MADISSQNAEGNGSAPAPNATGAGPEPVGPPSISIDVFHGHAEIETTGPVDLTQVQVGAPNGSWNRSVTPSANNTTVVEFLEPNRSYNLTYQAVLEGGRIWENQTTIQTAASPYAFAPLEDALIHPDMGIRMDTDESYGSSCTLNYILRGPTNRTLFALTAGHCIINDGVTSGQTIYTDPNGPTDGLGTALELGEPIGVVQRAVDGPGPVAEDWALVAIQPEYRSSVSPTVPRWGGPTGLLVGPVEQGDPLCQYGYAGEIRYVEEVRGRCGALGWVYASPPDDGGGLAVVEGPTKGGDSGAPVIHMDSGTAQGYAVSGLVGVFQTQNLCIVFSQIHDELDQWVRLVPGDPIQIDTPVVPGIPTNESPSGADFYHCPETVVSLHQGL